MEVFEQAEEGAEYVITNYRRANSNLRTHFQRIVTRAGVQPWPKLFHNLRATRQTELAEFLPGHVVCAWLGNTEDVAKAHYLQVTDAHFAKALQEPEVSPASAAQNPAQYGAVTGGIGEKGKGPETKEPPELPGVTDPYETVQKPKWPLSESNRLCPCGRGILNPLRLPVPPRGRRCVSRHQRDHSCVSDVGMTVVVPPAHCTGNRSRLHRRPPARTTVRPMRFRDMAHSRPAPALAKQVADDRTTRASQARGSLAIACDKGMNPTAGVAPGCKQQIVSGWGRQSPSRPRRVDGHRVVRPCWADNAFAPSRVLTAMNNGLGLGRRRDSRGR